jgi:hypothetical protein
MCTALILHGGSQLEARKLLQTLASFERWMDSIAPLCPASWGMRQNVPANLPRSR